MKKLIFLIFECPISVLGFCQLNTYNIKVEINGIGNDTVYVMYYPLSNAEETHTDTLLANGNRFTYKLPINQPAAVALIPQKSFYKRMGGGLYVPATKFIVLVVKPTDRLKIQGTLNKDYLDYKISGSSINETYSIVRHKYKKWEIGSVNSEIKIDSISNKGNEDSVIKKLSEERQKYNNIVRKIKLAYIKENLNKELSAFYLIRGQPLDTFGIYYPKLHTIIRNGIFKEALKNQYSEYQKYIATNEAEKKIVQGNIAPDFSLKMADGKLFTLSKLKGKYVILDFWGSWCGWCIHEFPAMKEYYDLHKTEIEIVGISCNDNDKNWRKAIDKYQLNWIQVLNSSEINVDVMYGIKAFPTKVILDKNLKIVESFVGEDENFYKKLNEFLK